MICKKTAFLAAFLAFMPLILLSCLSGEDNKYSTNNPPAPYNPDSGQTPAYRLPEVAHEERTEVTDAVILNAEASVPPQCYTKTEGRHNPCYTCHQFYDRQQGEDRLNQLDDGGLQGGYLFSDIGVTNHWKNLLADRRDWLASISDQDIINYTNTENYSELGWKLGGADWKGFIPDLQNYHLGAKAFDQNGLAKDGSHWVAFNYKPFPGTFWPTNGSTDDVLIRLPKAFRERDGQFDRDTYFANLTLVELNLKNSPALTLWDIDETRLGADLDGNGVLETTSHIRKGSHYIGDARAIALDFQQFPAGTELMHSVRYVGVSGDNIVIPPRMKELRYMKKVTTLPRSILDARYANERKEKLLGELPAFVNLYDQGFDNGMGWHLQGFIEDYNGELRPQTYEERMFCMGCHTAIGSTIDSTFSFARKVDGGEGWSYINLRGMPDAASRAETGGEILNYLKRSGGGSEFRENPEMVARWYHADGSVNEDKVRQADVYELVTPSTRRALDLNKAYTHIVRHQSYIDGRDATWVPISNTFAEINEDIPPLEPAYQYYGWDIRLDWKSTTPATPAAD